VFADRPKKHKYHLAPPSARLQEQGTTPFLPPRGRSRTISVLIFSETVIPTPKLKIGMEIPSPRFGAGIANAKVLVREIILVNNKP